MTDPLFLESAGLWLIGLATARRVYVPLEFQSIHNNLYALWVAPTTYYRKSTGLRAAEDVARAAVPHLLLAAQSSPEMLLYKLSGQKTTNFDDLNIDAQRLEQAGVLFAGQRGMISDEASKLFQKKYMEGLPEVLMEMAEAPAYLEQEYKGSGKLVVRNAGLSLLFSTTPQKLRQVFGNGEWEDGLLPRFALLTPSRPVVTRPPTSLRGGSSPVPAALVAALNAINSRLPQPKALDDSTGYLPAAAVECKVSVGALAGFNNYADALHDMTDPRAGLDNRLAGVYGRLPVHAVRVAMSLAIIEWAANSENGLEVTFAHWTRAQAVAESWRASAHRLLAEVTRSSDIENEDRLLGYLRHHGGQAPTVRQIHRGTRIASRRDVRETLGALLDEGVIAQVSANGRTGYQLVKEAGHGR